MELSFHQTAAPRIAIFLPSLHVGGAEQMMVNLLRATVAAGIPADLVLGQAVGPLLAQVPPQARVIDLGASHLRWAILRLARYLRCERPYCLLSRMSHANLTAAIARRVAGSKAKLVMIEASHFSRLSHQGLRYWAHRALRRRLYPSADAIVGVSEGVARELETSLGLPRHSAHIIYNPVVDERLYALAAAKPDHPWLFSPAAPLFLSVGRLEAPKDFGVLLRAFALVRKTRACRLLILGEGRLRDELESLIAELGIDDDVSLPGYAPNPYAAMSRATAYVQSSRSEGLPNALIEALACGCPAAATDCPSGPAEILAGGQYGPLVPVGDVDALAGAMSRIVDSPLDRDVLRRRGAEFAVSRALRRYLELVDYPGLGATTAENPAAASAA